MDDRRKPGEAAEDDYAGLNEATAGWDPYLSDLLNEPRRGFWQERRRTPRDRQPLRRRSLLLSAKDRQDGSDGQAD